MSYRLSQWEQISGQTYQRGAMGPAVFISRSFHQSYWQWQGKAVIIPYYPCPSFHCCLISIALTDILICQPDFLSASGFLTLSKVEHENEEKGDINKPRDTGDDGV